MFAREQREHLDVPRTLQASARTSADSVVVVVVVVVARYTRTLLSIANDKGTEARSTGAARVDDFPATWFVVDGALFFCTLFRRRMSFYTSYGARERQAARKRVHQIARHSCRQRDAMLH